MKQLVAQRLSSGMLRHHRLEQESTGTTPLGEAGTARRRRSGHTAPGAQILLRPRPLSAPVRSHSNLLLLKRRIHWRPGNAADSCRVAGARLIGRCSQLAVFQSCADADS